MKRLQCMNIFSHMAALIIKMAVVRIGTFLCFKSRAPSPMLVASMRRGAVGLFAAGAMATAMLSAIPAQATTEPEYTGMAWPIDISIEYENVEGIGGYWVIFRSSGWERGDVSPPEEQWELINECGSVWYRFWEPGIYDPNSLTEWEEAMGATTPGVGIPIGVDYQCENPDAWGDHHSNFAYVTYLERMGGM